MISLFIGNKSLYYCSSVYGDSSAVLVDWFSQTEIIGDTILSGQRYFNFDNEEFLRLEGNRVFTYSENGDIIKYNFEVEIGDTVDFQGNTLIVSDVSQKPILEDIQKDV